MTESLATIPLSKFTSYVNDAFKNYHSVLTLARSPLANSELIAPLLVLDDVSPTANERGNALRLLLAWATDKLAPGHRPHRHPHGRPLDDPAWRDPRWWRYNILRHRYLEPLHPDEFVQGGRFTETLVALTGIPSTDTFFDERNRAIREVAQWLQQQFTHKQADDELKQLALDEIYLPLKGQPSAHALLEIAATFEEVFPRALLLGMAAKENMSGQESAIDFLVAQRYLLIENANAMLLSPILQKHLYQRQPHARLQQRHAQAGEYFIQSQTPIEAANHFLLAQNWERAAKIVMQFADDLVNDLNIEELCHVLEKFSSDNLPSIQWRDIQILLSDLQVKIGNQEQALHACRQALKHTDLPPEQARIFRRMGKLYEKHNQLHALGYYQQAFDGFKRNDPEMLDLLKDRAWLYILRQEWEKAKSDLELALKHVPHIAKDKQADIYDALASLYRYQKQYDLTLSYARKALTLREESGDLGRVATSFGNLGLLYTDMSEFNHAIAAYDEARSTFEILGNQEAIATILLNIGIVRFLNNQIDKAIDGYQQSMELCQKIGLPLVEVRARYNLAEAYAGIGKAPRATEHWHRAYELSERCGFDDELADLLKLQSSMPALQVSEISVQDRAAVVTHRLPQIDPEDQSILQIAESQGRLTTKTLMEAIHVSKATANRRLAALVEQGHLQKYGKGRGTYYALPPADSNTSLNAALNTALSTAGDEHRMESTRGQSWQAIQERVEQIFTILKDEFGLRELGLIQQHNSTTQPVRMVVGFQVEPSLSRFFELEQQIASHLEMEVDLVLAGSQRDHQAGSKPDEVAWFR